MGILSGNPQDEPMHYGEVFGLYTQLSVTKAALDGYQVYYNHTGDKDLKEFIKDVINTSIKPEIKEIEELLLKNDIAVPPTPAERPSVDIEQIPVGARFQDAQVAYAIARDIAGGITSMSALIGQCIREDIALMLVQQNAKSIKDGAALLQIIKEKGWLVPPPLHMETKNQDQ
ncbi:DUF3231 family protein [Brevibacillus daliensis]|uniref:DUF3231 family protein n=1 Tax=Brevibacillus daliensis TaxID=2892995 RepID=UPI001E3CB88C|nr:DUF3231 family protein [Brevibacillus daliensis]